MEKGWIKLKVYSSAIEAEMVKQMLEENEVSSVIMNKQDSSYLFGRIELYVHESMEVRATQLINESENPNTSTSDVN